MFDIKLLISPIKFCSIVATTIILKKITYRTLTRKSDAT